MKAKIFITGATGFIGARVTQFLAAHGHDCVCLARKVTTVPTCLKDTDIQWVEGDICSFDPHAFKDVFETNRPDIILHIAGLTPRNAKGSAQDYHTVNVDGSHRLLEAATAINAKFIYASSVSVYGEPLSADGFVREDDSLAPQFPYAQSKADFEEILQKQDDIPYAILRYANIPGRDGFIHHCLKNKSATFYGDDLYVRDFIHLDDLCDLHGKMVDYLMNDGESVTLNCGSGIGFAFPDIVREIERQTGQTIEIHKAQPKENDVIRLICDIQRARSVLDWSPNKTKLSDIVSYALAHDECLSQKVA